MGVGAEIKYDEVIARIPMLHDLTLERFIELQQASMLEFCVDQVRELGVIGEDDSMAFWRSFQPFAESGDRTKLPYDPRFVRYPEGLLQWYQRALKDELLNLQDPKDESLVINFLDILQQRADLLARGTVSLAPFDQSFCDFHFNTVFAHKLQISEIQATVLTVWSCRCMHGKIGELALEVLRYMDECICSGETIIEGSRNFVKHFKEQLKTRGR